MALPALVARKRIYPVVAKAVYARKRYYHVRICERDPQTLTWSDIHALFGKKMNDEWTNGSIEKYSDAVRAAECAGEIAADADIGPGAFITLELDRGTYRIEPLTPVEGNVTPFR